MLGDNADSSSASSLADADGYTCIEVCCQEC